MWHKYLLTLLALILIAWGLLRGGCFLLAAWLGADLVVMGFAHWRGLHRILGKRPDGTFPAWSWIAFWPLLAYTLLVWHLLRLFSREPASHAITADLVIGRRLLPSEVPGRFDNYVDLTAEFSEPVPIRSSPGYRCFPILDGAAPTPEALRRAVRSLRAGRTFVHCAQGHGRSGLFTLAMLLDEGTARTIAEGLSLLAAVRPGVRLSRDQLKCIQRFAEARRSPGESSPQNSKNQPALNPMHTEARDSQER